jgi:rod shape determining protein RodA
MYPRDLRLLVVMVLLEVLSIATLRGISIDLAYNQLFFALIGVLAFLFVSAFNWQQWQKSRWLWYGGVIFLLLLTLLFGRVTKGSMSWLQIGHYRLQPSELLKPALLLLLATHFRLTNLQDWRNIGSFALIASFPLLLVMMQPDLGTALTIIAGVGSLFLLLNPPKKIIMGIFVFGVVGMITAWLFLLKPYQKDRLRTFVDPAADAQGSGYNAQQAMIAVGSGGLFGQGIGQGRQSHLRFLPERQTDFLFATYAEERGFIGSSALILLYVGLFGVIGQYAQKAQEKSALNYILAGAAMLFAQTFVNIGMNIGLNPVTGIPLPLFSLGGSSILATSILLGLMESCRRSQPPAKKRFT